MYRVEVDELNKKAQVIVRDSMAGISLMFLMGSETVDEYGATDQFINQANVRVELVRRSQPNAVLYDMKLKDLYNVWGAFSRKPKGVVIPFALSDNLLLSKDAYLQIDVSWPLWTDETIDGLNVQPNSVATSTNVPISFKRVSIAGELEIDTEHFEYVLIPQEITKLETFVDGYRNELQPLTVSSDQLSRDVSLSKGGSSSRQSSQLATGDRSLQNVPKVNTGACGCDGVLQRQKIEMDYSFLSYFSTLPTNEKVLFKTQPDQKIKFFGEGEIVLMQA